MGHAILSADVEPFGERPDQFGRANFLAFLSVVCRQLNLGCVKLATETPTKISHSSYTCASSEPPRAAASHHRNYRRSRSLDSVDALDWCFLQVPKSNPSHSVVRQDYGGDSRTGEPVHVTLLGFKFTGEFETSGRLVGPTA